MKTVPSPGDRVKFSAKHLKSIQGGGCGLREASATVVAVRNYPQIGAVLRVIWEGSAEETSVSASCVEVTA